MTTQYVLVEGCVTSVDEAVRVATAGAGRIELCRDLHLDGLTPAPSLIRETKAAVDIPVFVMVRPHASSFGAGADEIALMEREIGASVDAGADGIVVGVLDAQGGLSSEALGRLVRAAGPVPVTIHRAFDRALNLDGALEVAIDSGAHRVLTGGGAGRAIDQAERLADLTARAGDRIGILVAGGVRAEHVVELVARTRAREVHARASAVAALVRALADRA